MTINSNFMDDYFSGNKLYGDDFTLEKINKWYDEEAEGYAELIGDNKDKTAYGYHEINKFHGYNKIKNDWFEKVLGLGSSWGFEFEPVISRIGSLTILEPSERMHNSMIGNIIPTYAKPEPDGRLNFSSNTIDLITCFGTLHHIPNVTFVLNEIIRVLKPGGYLLIREPIVSMGDWNFPRRGLTKNERGIPLSFFDKVFKEVPVEIISREYCFTLISVFQKTLGKLLNGPVYEKKWYCVFDAILSWALQWNTKYHSHNILHKVAPSSIFYVIRKVSQCDTWIKAMQ